MNTMVEEERKKCNRCKVNLLLKDYKLKRDGLYSKNCFKCLDGFTRTRGKRREKNKDKFECKECDIKFNNNGHLQRHIKSVHLNIRDFECKECDMKFSDNSKLKRHINSVHLKIQDYICEYDKCEFTCSTNVNLQRLQEKKLKIAKQQAEIKKQKMLKTSENLKIKTQTINLDLADKISKIIPYSLIPIIPIAVAYFVFKGSK